MSRLRNFHLRASRYGGQVVASASRARVFLATLVFVAISGNARAFACPMCFSNVEETALVDGTKLGILAMLAIVLAVQAAFVGFFLYLRRQAQRAAEIELETEWSELQRSPRTS
jgi:heme/copper-type cytochrome/quinol oxidase subunit 2